MKIEVLICMYWYMYVKYKKDRGRGILNSRFVYKDFVLKINKSYKDLNLN